MNIKILISALMHLFTLVPLLLAFLEIASFVATERVKGTPSTENSKNVITAHTNPKRIRIQPYIKSFIVLNTVLTLLVLLHSAGKCMDQFAWQCQQN